MERVPEIGELCRFLRKAGFDVWLIDANEQRQLEVVAREFDFDASRVRGIRGKVEKDKLTGAILLPVPIRGGKAAIVSSDIGRSPALVVGVGNDDQELLLQGEGLRIILDRGDEELRRLAAEKGWLTQPAFGPLPKK
jgi:phosphoserine phosphatase